MRINIMKPKQLWKVGDVLKTTSGDVYMICFDGEYYFLVNLQSGRCSCKYMSMTHLRDSDMCDECSKVSADLTLI